MELANEWANPACEPVAPQEEIQETGEFVQRCRNDANQTVASQVKWLKLWPDVAQGWRNTAGEPGFKKERIKLNSN